MLITCGRECLGTPYIILYGTGMHTNAVVNCLKFEFLSSVYVCMYACMYVCIDIYIYIHLRNFWSYGELWVVGCCGASEGPRASSSRNPSGLQKPAAQGARISSPEA